MGNISLESFKNVAGSSASIGYVVADNKGELQKVAAHRHFMTGRNVAQTPGDSDANARLRTQLFNAVRTAVVGTAAEASATQRSFLLEIGKQLGISFKLGDDGQYDFGDASQCSQKPLERRVLRAVLHETDVQIAADKVSCENAENARTQGANAKTVYRTVEASELPKAEQKTARMFDAKAEGFKKFSLADQKAVLEAFGKLRDAGFYSSAECVVGGKTVWLSRTNSTNVSVEFPSGKAISVDMGDLNEKIADNVAANPKKAKAGELRAALNSVYVSPLQLRGPAPTRLREMAQKVLLSLCGPGTKLGGAKGLSEGDLLTVSPQRMRKLALEVLNGDYGTEKAFREGLGNAETRDLINSEEILKLADQFDAASEQEQEMVKTLGANAVKKPVSAGKSLLNMISGFFSFGKKEPAPQPKVTAQDVKNLVADLIHDEDTIAMDRLHGQPGKQMAHTLGKHTDTLAALLCNPDAPELKELPDEYRTIVDEMIKKMAENPTLSAKVAKADVSGVKELLDTALSTGVLDGSLVDAQHEIDEKTQHKFLYMQAAIRHGFAGMLAGGAIDVEGFVNRLETEVDDLRETHPDMAEADLVDLASETLTVQDRLGAEDAKAVRENPRQMPKTEKELHMLALEEAKANLSAGPAKDANAPAVDSAPVKDIARKSGYQDLGEMMKKAGMSKADVDKATTEPVKPSNVTVVGNETIKKSDEIYKREVAAYEKEMVDYKAFRLEKSKEALKILLGKSALDTTSGYSAFMIKVMDVYFKGMSVDDQRNMLAAGIRYMPSKEQIRENKMNEGTAMLGAMLKGAGPIMQKMLQGLASTDCDPSFKAALKDMKSKLAPIPDNVVKANLLDMVKRSNGQILSIEVTKNLGAASVGQAFFCKVTLAEKDDNGNNLTKDVVVKMLRPDAEQRAKREADIFKEASKKVPGMEVTFAGQLASIMEELDLRIEAENTKQGVVYDKGGKQVSSMKVMDLIPPTRYTFVVEKAPGRTVDDLFDQVKGKIASSVEAFYEKVPVIDPETKQPKLDEKGEVVMETKLRAKLPGKTVAENVALFTKARKELSDLYETTLIQQKRLVTLAEKWSLQGIFDSGFYHGDLHAGNIMVDDEFARDEKGELLRDKNGNLVRNANGDLNGGLTVIDFGNATKLTTDQQKQVIIMMSAAAIKNTDLFMEGFRKLMTDEGRAAFDRQKNRIHDTLHNVFNLGMQKQAGERIALALQEMQKLGFELPGPIFKFSQCQMRLQGTIDEMNALLEQIQTAMREFCAVPSNQPVRSKIDNSMDVMNDLFSSSSKGNAEPSSVVARSLNTLKLYAEFRDNPPEDAQGAEPDAKKFPEENRAWRNKHGKFSQYKQWKKAIKFESLPPNCGEHVGFATQTLTSAPADMAMRVLTGEIAIKDAKRPGMLQELGKIVHELAVEFDDPEIESLFADAKNFSDEKMAPVEAKIEELSLATQDGQNEVSRLSGLIQSYPSCKLHIALQEKFSAMRQDKLDRLLADKKSALEKTGLSGTELDTALETYKNDPVNGLTKDFDNFLNIVATKSKNVSAEVTLLQNMEELRNQIQSEEDELNKLGADDPRRDFIRKDIESKRASEAMFSGMANGAQEKVDAVFGSDPDQLAWAKLGALSDDLVFNATGGKTLIYESVEDDRKTVAEIDKNGGLWQLHVDRGRVSDENSVANKALDDYKKSLLADDGPLEDVAKHGLAFARKYEELMFRRLEKMQQNLEVFEEHGEKQETEDFTDAIGTVIDDNMLASAGKMGLINSVFRVKPKLQVDQTPA